MTDMWKIQEQKQITPIDTNFDWSSYLLSEINSGTKANILLESIIELYSKKVSILKDNYTNTQISDMTNKGPIVSVEYGQLKPEHKESYIKTVMEHQINQIYELENEAIQMKKQVCTYVELTYIPPEDNILDIYSFEDEQFK